MGTGNFLELSRQIHIEWQSKHNYIHVIYKVLVYVQTSQPTTCFGLFQLGHLQVGHKGQRNYTIWYIIIKVRGDEISFTNFGHVCRLEVLKYMCNDNSALMCSSSDLYVQPEDGLTGRGRNMYLAETFIHTPTPCILHEYSCVLTAILYEFV